MYPGERFNSISHLVGAFLAVAGAAHEHPWIMVFGLILSIALMGLAATLWATVRATAFRARATRSWTALAIAPVVKAWVAALILAATAVTVATFAAAIALAFKARSALWAIAA